jgi:hypothetical protein
MEAIKEAIVEEIIETAQEGGEEELADEIGIEYTTRSDYISAAYFAIASVEGIDTGIMTKEDAKRIKRIMRKSLMIIDDCITEMYDELYENDDDENG